ncbi:hypothetical protein VTP01DRAFT_6055 [Rhizomucor pusillus]|uniref:uncharacterized protein n=1 Tax=Rhizomucor pusillus TaxID=4840 RepID=UPI003743D338
MEFPDLGKHCTFDGCKQLDFLPYTCYHCKKIFCQEHFKLEDHKCPSLNDPNLDVRIPTCPICEKPVPGPRNEDPNIRVNRHIQNNCVDAKKPSNICDQRGCKAKLLVPMQCQDCRQSFCIKHRLPVDHQCTKKSAATSSSNARPQQSSSKTTGFAQSVKNGFKGGRNNRQQQDISRAEMERQRLSRVQAANQRRQELTLLQQKAQRMALTEDEQVRLATLLSLEDKKDKNCIVS